ncbi:MAG: hypothetical protein ACK4PR_12865, partial [Gammaproteobacteria bacterium]
LTVPTSEWTDVFKGTLAQLVTFIKDGFNDSNNQRLSLLKHSSYPNALLREIDDLMAVANGEEPIVSFKMAVLTPILVTTSFDAETAMMLIAHSGCSAEEKLMLIRRYAEQIETFSDTGNAFYNILSPFSTSEYLWDIYDLLKHKQDELKGQKFYQILRMFPNDADRVIVIKELRGKLEKLDSWEFYHISKLFTNETRRLEIQELLKNKLEKLTIYKLYDILKVFSNDAERVEACKIFKSNLVLLNGYNLALILNQFDQETTRVEVCKIFRNNLRLLDGCALVPILNQFDDETVRVEVCKILIDILFSLEDYEFIYILEQFTDEKNRERISEILNDKLASVINAAPIEKENLKIAISNSIDTEEIKINKFILQLDEDENKKLINSEKIAQLKRQTALGKELIKIANDFAYPQLLSEPYSRRSSFEVGIAKSLIEYFEQNALVLTSDDIFIAAFDLRIKKYICEARTQGESSNNIERLLFKAKEVIQKSGQQPSSDHKLEQPVV